METGDDQALRDILATIDRAMGFPIPDFGTLAETDDLQDALMRCLIHAYDRVDLQDVWQAYRQFPGLRQKIEEILNRHC